MSDQGREGLRLYLARMFGDSMVAISAAPLPWKELIHTLDGLKLI